MREISGQERKDSEAQAQQIAARAWELAVSFEGCARARAHPCPAVQLTGARRGRARSRSWSVTVPTWAADCGAAYFMHYVLHEIAHLAVWSSRHDDAFRGVEQKLFDAFGLHVRRDVVYVRPGMVGRKENAGAIDEAMKQRRREIALRAVNTRRRNQEAAAAGRTSSHHSITFTIT